MGGSGWHEGEQNFTFLNTNLYAVSGHRQTQAKAPRARGPRGGKLRTEHAIQIQATVSVRPTTNTVDTKAYNHARISIMPRNLPAFIGYDSSVNIARTSTFCQSCRCSK